MDIQNILTCFANVLELSNYRLHKTTKRTLLKSTFCVVCLSRLRRRLRVCHRLRQWKGSGDRCRVLVVTLHLATVCLFHGGVDRRRAKYMLPVQITKLGELYPLRLLLELVRVPLPLT